MEKGQRCLHADGMSFISGLTQKIKILNFLSNRVTVLGTAGNGITITCVSY